MLNEIKKSSKTDSKVIPVALMRSIEEYLIRCGINEPFDKIYVKNAHELVKSDMGRIMATMLIAQLPKLQICFNTGTYLR